MQDNENNEFVNYHYDKKYNILYINFADKSNSYQEDLVNKNITISVSKDCLTGKITGLTIFDFDKNLKILIEI